MTKLRSIGTAALLVLVAHAAVHAQATSSTSSPPTAAEQLITVGIGMRQRGDDAGALRLFQQAYQISPSARALGQMALAEQALGRWLDAESHMREVLAQGDDPWVRRSRNVLTPAYQEVRTHVAELLVEGASSGDVVLNGDIVAVLPMQDPLRVLAGDCMLEVRAPGFSSETRRMFLPGGEITRIVVELRPMIMGVEGATATSREPAPESAAAAPARRRDHTLSHWLGYGGVGLGVASLVVGAIMTGNVFASADALNAPGCQQARDGWIRPELNCPSTQSSFDTALTAQWVAYGIGAVLMGVGVGILLVDASSNQERESTSTPVSVACSTTGSSASCSMRF